eukprot:CAMPEP_0114582182 /NCGR_PEP_ID=MMETSP0125-20121206/6207_1 /TAXON_ID=485358 ORGANISM="Aristerostoma sp., Strain ATCC 50986" /NCGR_SAMPLE_ID=MMETSP0125 /ASSEMBLY_ACC=CAM_ASM_000245 /LENGTH=47 /DNA_ID= /DNA_START= /DNA_END= /DNA_ORIENTATION=
MTELLDGKYDTHFLVFDCRYKYEYTGGHIKGAINITTKETLMKLLFT